ncbi:MAG: hypothetical protein HY902_06455 [Deltaproteobacteria bacterium]|nr:hypothetical protein [Deltaproteobacteria bacterium]
MEDLAAYLDGLSADERLAQCRALGRAQQRQLFQLASPAIGVDDLVPASIPAQTAVVQEGTNTLPLPPPWQRFQKPMCRPADGSPRLFGYNEGSTRPLIGPGYFVAYGTDDRPEWAERGGVVVDYYQVPDGPVAPGWPKVVPNSRGLQMFVFQGTRDFMRKVSTFVTIGAAYKGEKALDHYFVLVRQ